MDVKKETWIRTFVLAVSLLNQILTLAGKNPLPFSNEGLYQAFTALFTTGASLWTWWKNNSFTTQAVQADQYLKELKTAAKSVREGDRT